MPIAARPVSIAQRLLPVLGWLPAYRRDWLLSDVLAGLAVWAVMVPEGMAYAGIVGVPPIMGLYTIVRPLIAYALLGYLAHAGRRPGHRYRPDLGADGGRHRGTGNCGVQYAHLQPRDLDRILLPAVRRAAHGLGGCLHPHAGDARVHRRPRMRHNHRPSAASAGNRGHVW